MQPHEYDRMVVKTEGGRVSFYKFRRTHREIVEGDPEFQHKTFSTLVDAFVRGTRQKMPRARDELSDAVQQASKETGIPWNDILSPSQRRPIARARHRVMRLLKDLGWNKGEIAQAMHLHKKTVQYGLTRGVAK